MPWSWATWVCLWTLHATLMVGGAPFAHRERKFAITDRHALVGHSIAGVRSGSSVQCSVLCLRREDCRSFNYDWAGRVCQLSDARREDFLADFMPSGDFAYFEAMTFTSESVVGTPTSFWTSSQTPEAEATTAATSDCNTANDGPMGMASGLIPDDKISASSINDGFIIAWTRISERGWCAKNHDVNQWLQVDFVTKVYVTGVQCGSYWNGNSYIDEYKVLYGDDGTNWSIVQNETETGDAVFDGPPDRDTVVTSTFPTAVYARFIRLQPTAWHVYVCMRFELLGCR